MEEVWKDVKGYEGYYEVSNLGRVRSVGHPINGGKQKTTGKIRKLVVNNSGYMAVNLKRNFVEQRKLVHRLVAEAFIPNPNGFGYVDHIDRNRLNNEVSNLQWVTQGDNLRASYARGRKPYIPTAEDRKKISDANSRAVIRGDGKRYKSLTEAAMDTGISKSAVYQAARGNCRTAGGYTFSYADS